MFGNISQPTKLIIVCTDDTREYGDYLMQLISLKDDTQDNAVGLKDGSVEAVLWNERDYKGNSATLPASAHILFIGTSKLIEGKSAHMRTVYSKYGMSFKALGSQAVMSVDKKLPSDEDYKNFLELATEYQQEVDGVKSNAVKGVAVGILAAILSAPAGIIGGLFAINKTKNKILNQRYAFLTLYSYMELLSAFIEG